MIGIRLDKNKKMSITKDIKEISPSKTVYIPLINAGDDNVTTFVKKNDYVFKGQIIGKTKGNFAIPLFASVSGIVRDLTTKTFSNGKTIKCVEIENDFEDREDEEQERVIKSNLNDFTKKEFIDRLYECGIVGMGGSSFPTYIKYKTDSKIKTLIVNGVECEPYITADYMLMKTKIPEILECCDAIMDICQIDECYIAIKIHNDELKEIFKSFIGTYPKIRLIEVPDMYPMGWEKSLVRYIKHTDYEKLPIEKGIVVNNVSTIYAIYEALKEQKPLIERIVTFSGILFKNPMNVRLKVGTNVKEVIEQVVGLEENEYTFVSGGPMMGEQIPSSDFIISASTNCILAVPKVCDIDPINCLRCGKCVRVCPAKITPVMIKDYINDKEELKKLNVNKCIECGLCSYICPSKILVREYVREAKRIVKGDK